MLRATFVTTAEELDQIAGLSAANLVTNLTADEKAKEGYVTWSYPPDTLRILHAITPSVIVKDGDLAVGYAIVLTRECAAVYEPMREAIRHFSSILLVTEISATNPRSMRAHAKTGFAVVDTRLDETGEWNVVVWDWKL